MQHTHFYIDFGLDFQSPASYGPENIRGKPQSQLVFKKMEWKQADGHDRSHYLPG